MSADSEKIKTWVAYWRERGYERGETQSFWLSLLSQVLGVAEPERHINFEARVKLEHTNFIDAWLPETKVMIEQKGRGQDLGQPLRQSDGTYLTPIQQAKRYAAELPYSQRPRWIVTCNFQEFRIYDMEHPSLDPVVLQLEELPQRYPELRFLTNFQDERLKREMELSLQAGELVGRLYDALLVKYQDPNDPQNLHSLNMLCVRLVFCLYADDSGLFGGQPLFHHYLEHWQADDLRRALIDLFEILDTPEEERDPYLEDYLAAFPYVNGGLFSQRQITIPQFDEKIRHLLLYGASEDFNWKHISPTIFGAVFESTLNPQTRRSGGMHYTSIANIHKVIDPLFLDDLRAELEAIKKRYKSLPARQKALRQFQTNLAQLYFLDPACGSGNFLTETYLCLRRLENEVLKLLQGGSISFGGEGFNPIQVSIGQFYGIEINDFAVTVAKTALWIAESQMMRETEDVVHMDLDFLPLKSYAHIVWGDALQLDWAEVVPPPRNNLKYIIGNPPFIGYWLQTPAQKEALRRIYVDGKGKPYKGGGKIDYVAGWYFKAAQFMAGTSIRAALVATNSITQGEQVAFFWEPLFKRFGIHIDFAHRTFRWDSEATLKAQVHVVIIGFSCAPNPKPRLLFYSDQAHQVQNITPYLLDTPTIFIKSRPRALCKVPPMVAGNKPTDGGAFFLTPSEREEVLQREPQIEPFIRPVMGSQEFIYGERRYCLWLTEATPQDIRSSPFLRERVERVRQFRLASVNKATRNDAQTPHLFQQIHHKECPYILVPSVSSDRRAYIPLGFVPAEVISTNLNLMVPGATLYHFAVLTSNVHMAWMRAVCGRLGVGYRYSKDVVYNNFVWPEVNEETRQKIARCGQRILEVRSHYPQSSLADLYDPATMPPDLRRAHQENDRAVMEAYGLPIKTTTEAACVSFLFLEFQRYIREET